MNYRQRWFAENRQEYFDAPLNCPPPWRCVGGSGAAMPERVARHPPVPKMPPPASREPGEDWDEPAGVWEDFGS